MLKLKCSDCGMLIHVDVVYMGDQYPDESDDDFTYSCLLCDGWMYDVIELNHKDEED